MALVESNSFQTGRVAPNFSLPDTVSGQTLSLAQVSGKHGTVVMFICNHCPFVVHVNPELVRLANDYRVRGFGFVAISSNDVQTYPEDGPDQMKQTAEQMGYPFPYLYDESQEIARLYDAACTPDFYVFDSDLHAVYHGQLDDSRPKNGKPLDGHSIRNVLDALLSGNPVPAEQFPSIGCNIKWRH
ncbi:MAG: thioredoxin family protein [Ignavibacteria bacterium]|nr:thioredoxin family protein [Ignavibacteria bacterium]